LAFDANNRIMGVTGVGYDLGGNLTSDGSGPGTHTYFYDAENRIIQVDGTLGTCSTATACYVYNAEGQRVRKTTGISSMDHLYDLGGHKVAEVGPAGVFMRGELYAGGRHFAIFAPEPGPTGATFFTHSDWLGTERVRTDMTGTNCESIASLPYGASTSPGPAVMSAPIAFHDVFRVTWILGGWFGLKHPKPEPLSATSVRA
jgi:hypothetical protein